METWKTVPDWPTYEVSDQGEVHSTDHVVFRGSGQLHIKGKRIKGWVDSDGYRKINLYDTSNGRRKTTSAHVLVMRAFAGPPSPEQQVLHINGQPADNRRSNLRYGTAKENVRQTVTEGTHSETRKTHCKHGHEFTEVNTRITPKGDRACRACARAHAARYYAQRKS